MTLHSMKALKEEAQRKRKVRSTGIDKSPDCSAQQSGMQK